MGILRKKGGDLARALTDLQKQFGMGAVMRLGDRVQEPVSVFSSGSLALDFALGIGGLPRGRVVEIYGPESSGKTTMTLHAIAELQRAGGTAAFVDAEHALDVRYAANLGVDVANLIVSQPDAGEQALEIVEALARTSEVDLIVVDSVAALTPQAEIDGQMGDSHMGLQARLMSQALRKLTAVTHRERVTVIFINQIRSKIGVLFGSSETTTGGNALKFYASVRLDIRRAAAIKRGEERVGNHTRVKVVKNKLAPPFRTAEFPIYYGRGVDRAAELVQLAVAEGIVTKNGAWFSWDEERLGQGQENARAAVAEDASLLERLEKAVRGRLAAKDPLEAALGPKTPAKAPLVEAGGSGSSPAQQAKSPSSVLNKEAA